MNKADLIEKVAKMSLNLKVNACGLYKHISKIEQTKSLCELIAGEQGDKLR